MSDYFFVLYNYSDWALLGLRLAVGAIFLAHGLSKCSTWKAQPSSEMPAGMLATMRFLSIAETLGAAALILGFLTLFASAGLAVIMFGAIYFKIAKWQAKFTGNGGWELDLILLAANIALFVLGAGRWSVDYFLGF